MSKKKPQTQSPKAQGKDSELQKQIYDLTEALQRERADATNLRDRAWDNSFYES